MYSTAPANWAKSFQCEVAFSVIIIVLGNAIVNPSSNPALGCLYFCAYAFEKGINLSVLKLSTIMVKY